MPYMLNTNVCIELLRGRNALLIQRFHARPTSDLRICSVVLSELIRGTLLSRNPAANRAKMDAFVKLFVSLPFNNRAAKAHARLRYQLDSQGTPIGPYDLQIAAIALVQGLTVVTHNVAEFSRVPGLTIEDWEVP
jgi:tRNA(fMet)-specific endonuclease VapC